MLTVTRVALLTRHIDFTIKAKHALENYQGSAYFVSAFTSVQNLMTFLEKNEQDVAILDLTVREVVPDKLLTQIRALQPDIKLVVSPNHPAVLTALASLSLQGIIDIPMPTRKLLGFMKKLISTSEEASYVLMPNAADTQNLTVAADTTLPTTSPLSPAAEEIFRKLAAEEPPMPPFEESATVADVVENFILLSPETRLELLLQAEPDITQDAPSDDGLRGSLVAQIFEAAMDSSTPVNAVLNKVRERLTAEDVPERANREPDFLAALPPLEYSAATTGYHAPDRLEDGNNLETDRLEPVVRSRPVLKGDFPGLDELRPELIASTDTPASTEQLVVAALPMMISPDQEVVQLAVTLTEMSLETAADAIILVRQQAIVAYSGRLPRTEIDGLLNTLLAPWDDDRSTYIDFVRLEAASTDYVLYGSRTPGDFLLYLLFAGSVPISAIRRQGRRLGDVLDAMPPIAEPAVVYENVPVAADRIPVSEPAGTDEVELPDDEVYADDSEEAAVSASMVLSEPLSPYNFVWVLRDASNPLDNESAQSLITALNTTLTQRTWQIRNLDVYGDFVYLRADLPQSQGANRAVRDAMRASAELLQPTTPAWAKSLWADSYLVVPSQRELSMDEIQSFIRFARS